LLTNRTTGTELWINKCLALVTIRVGLPFNGRTPDPQTGLATGTFPLINLKDLPFFKTPGTFDQAAGTVGYND
jgi:hypothetical protein